MATIIQINEGEETATITLQSSPSFVRFSGSEELKSDIEFESKFAYNSVGHIMNLGNIHAQDLYIFLVALNSPVVSSIYFLNKLSKTHATKCILACSPPLKKL